MISETGDTSELADHALVFMFCPFGDICAQPIGVLAAKSATKGTILAQLLLQVLVLMEEAGAKIHKLVMGHQRIEICEAHWVLQDCCNFFTHPSDPTRKVFAFSGVPHLFKCIRNDSSSRTTRRRKANG